MTGTARSDLGAGASTSPMSRPNSAAISSASSTLPAGRTLLGHWQRTDIADQIVLVHTAQPEQQFRLGIEPSADAQQRRRDVLAHRGVVRATAGELDLRWLREQAGALTANPLHHAFGKPALQQFHKRIDAAGAIAQIDFHCGFGTSLS